MPIINAGGKQINVVDDQYSGQEKRVNKKELSKDDFIRIFLTQMRVQNPLKPFDSSTMLQQMSQLTALTASEELQKTIKNLNVTIGKSEILSASQLINKKVQIPADASPLVAGEGLGGSVVVPGDASNIIVTIKDPTGKVVKTIDKGSSTSGILDFDWDGKDSEGKEMAAGFYQISATATLNGKTENLPTAGTYKVKSVAMNPVSGNVYLNLDGYGGIDLSGIIKII